MKWNLIPPKHSNIVLVFWDGGSTLGDRLLGQYYPEQETWTVYGLATVHGGRTDVKAWQELPKAPKL